MYIFELYEKLEDNFIANRNNQNFVTAFKFYRVYKKNI